jgi:plastocyanin
LAVAADAQGALAFTKTTLTTNAGRVVVAFANPSQVPHAVVIEDHGIAKSTPVVTDANATMTLTLTPGTYAFYCPVDGHSAAGMEGTLTAR